MSIATLAATYHKSVRFSPYSSPSPSRSRSRSGSPGDGVSSSHVRASDHRRPSTRNAGQHLEVTVSRSSKSPSPSALSTGSEGSDEARGMREGSGNSYSGKESDAESVASGFSDSMGIKRLGLGHQNNHRGILDPSARRRPPPPALHDKVRSSHHRSRSFGSAIPAPLHPMSVGYMLCPSPRSAASVTSMRNIQNQIAGHPVITVTKSTAPLSSDETPSEKQHQQSRASSPRSPRFGTARPLSTIMENPPTMQHRHLSQGTQIPSNTLRRHSAFGPHPPYPPPGHTLVRGASPPSSGSSSKGPGSMQSLERMMLVNPKIAHHLKRGGAVSVKSVDGSKSWTIRIPIERLAAMKIGEAK